MLAHRGSVPRKPVAISGGCSTLRSTLFRASSPRVGRQIMGQEIPSTQFQHRDFEHFQRLLDDEAALFHEWVEQQHFSKRKAVGGLELEGWLVDDQGMPQPRNEEFLELADNPDIVAELSKFSFEVNAPPQKIKGDGLELLEAGLERGWRACQKVATRIGLHALAIGILPTVTDAHLTPANMTSLKRYKALNEQLLRVREGRPMRMEIVGREHLSAMHLDVMLEALATSFQVHLQVPAKSAARYWNAAEIVSAATVALASNSPFAFGKLLWEESRIPVFEQAFGVENPERRVTFGSAYVHSFEDLFTENRRYYPVLLPMDFGEPPEKMAHLKLHNGTIWRWNRPLIGFDEDSTPHLRVEHRVMSAGPTTLDMIANMAFFYGLVEWLVMEPHAPELRLEFAMAKQNFYAGAWHGLDASVYWYDGKHWELRRLILEMLLPQARKGLRALHVSESVINRYLDVIAARTESGQTGAAWQRAFAEAHGRDFPALVNTYRQLQNTGAPVHTWTV